VPSKASNRVPLAILNVVFMTQPPFPKPKFTRASAGAPWSFNPRTNPSKYEPLIQKKVALIVNSRQPALQDSTVLAQAIVWIVLLTPSCLWAGGWPWGKQPPDQVTASCTIHPPQIAVGSSSKLQARVEAADTREHKLAYVWSGNGGQIFGSGATVELDVSRLNPGVYSLAAAVQDAYKNRAECVAQFQVIVPPDPLTARCIAEPAEAQPGVAVRIRAEASDQLGHVLRYRWFTNGGVLLPEGAGAQLQTADMPPGEYTITGRIEDDWGHATDCTAIVKVTVPPPPPVPPELANLAQIVFARNMAQLGAAERQQLQKVLDRLQNDRGGDVSLESYAAPDENMPQKLAAARAEVVKHFLLEQGVSEERIRTHIGLGGRLGGTRNRTVDVIWIPLGMVY
jgi:outer membrane protein OmpA-like peptidoglycan-associated protein